MRNLARRTGRNYAGYTILEMLIVIAIIVFLFTLIAVVATRVREKARMSKCKAMIKNIHVILDAYKAMRKEFPPLDIDQWPNTAVMPTLYQGVQLDRSLVYLGTTLEEGAFTKGDFDPTGTYFIDPWGNALRYRKLSADRMLIWSYGPNGKDEIGLGQVWDPKSNTYVAGTGGGEQETQGDDISTLNVDY